MHSQLCGVLMSCPLGALLSRLGSWGIHRLISSLSVWPNDQRLLKVSLVGRLMREGVIVCDCVFMCVVRPGWGELCVKVSSQQTETQADPKFTPVSGM